MAPTIPRTIINFSSAGLTLSSSSSSFRDDPRRLVLVPFVERLTWDRPFWDDSSVRPPLPDVLVLLPEDRDVPWTLLLPGAELPPDDGVRVPWIPALSNRTVCSLAMADGLFRWTYSPSGWVRTLRRSAIRSLAVRSGAPAFFGYTLK